MTTIEDIIRIAVKAHDGMKDMVGNPAVAHVLAVGLMGKTVANLSQSATCSFCLVGEGSGSQEWGGYMLLISIPADFTTRIHSYKDNDFGRFNKWPGIGRCGGGIVSGRRMEVVDLQYINNNCLVGFNQTIVCN